MQCPRCGATVIAQSTVCPICGQSFGVASRSAGGSPARASIHDAQTVVMQRGTTVVVETPDATTAAEVAAFVAGLGRSMVASQWERWWWKILVIGIVLYLAINRVTYSTANVFLLPQLFMIGTFLVPIVYVAYLYEHGTLYDVPLNKLALVFFFGGVLGSLAASLLEARLISGVGAGIFGSMTLSDAFIVGFSEELAKLIVVLPFLFGTQRRYPTIMHGIVLGAAAGMGFAAFESMGYAFLALVSTSGGIDQSIAAMHDTIRLRALLAPLGHGTWTAIIAAAMWRERVHGRLPLTLNVLLAFAVSVLLHMLWDYLPPLRLPVIDLPLMLLLLGAIGLLILRFFLQVAKGGTDGAYGEPNLARALPMYFRGLRGEARDLVQRRNGAKR
jgi:protease PrsW